MGFTYGQTKALSIVPHVTGFFSFVGSSWIIVEIAKDRKKWGKPYHRILFAMCVFDALSSIALGLSTWPIPEGSDGVYAPMGNTATCSAQAFFIQANIASPIYNFVLSLYYLLMVRYRVPENTMNRRIEPIMQILTISFALGTSFVALGLDLFNDSSLWCWINASPKGCEQSYKHGETTCERGDNAEIYRWAFFFVPLWSAVFGTMVTMWMLYSAVRAQEKKTEQWDFEQRARRDSSSKDETTSAEEAIRNKQAKARNCKSRMVAAQAFRYVAVFYVTWVAGTINRLLQLFLGRSFFTLFLLHSIFTPLQGFFNFLVYKYPKFVKWRRARKGRSEIEMKTYLSTGPESVHYRVSNPRVSSLIKNADQNSSAQTPSGEIKRAHFLGVVGNESSDSDSTEPRTNDGSDKLDIDSAREAVLSSANDDEY